MRKETMNDEPYRELAAAIIKLAIKDYEKAYKRLLRDPGSETAKRSVERERKFFHSGWYEVLSDTDGPRLVRMIEEKVKAEYRARGGEAR